MFKNKRVDHLRSEIEERLSALNDLKSKTANASFHQKIELAQSHFEEIEMGILERVEKEEMPELSVMLWLRLARFMLATANQEALQLLQAFESYGSRVLVIG